MGKWRYMKLEVQPYVGILTKNHPLSWIVSIRFRDTSLHVFCPTYTTVLTLEKLSGPQDITRPSPRRAAKAKAVASKKATQMQTEGRMWDIRRTKLVGGFNPSKKY